MDKGSFSVWTWQHHQLMVSCLAYLLCFQENGRSGREEIFQKVRKSNEE